MRLLDLFKRKKQTLPREEIPRYIVKGLIDEQKIHMGTCVKTGFREVCYLMFENGEWFLYSVVSWPIHHGVDDGREIKIKLNSDFFISNKIHTMELFLNYIYQGTLKPCRAQLQSHKNILAFLENLMKEKLQASARECNKKG